MADSAWRTTRAVVFDVGGVLRDSRAALDASYRAVLSAWLPDARADLDALYRVRAFESFNAVAETLAAVRLGVPLAPALRLAADAGERDLRARVDAAWAALPGDAVRAAVRAEVTARAAEFRAVFAAPSMGALVRLYPGLENALAALRACGLRLAVLSNSSDAAVRRDLAALPADTFDFVVTEARKPDPGVLLAALAAHGLAPESVVYVGDAASDVAVARAAGTRAAAVLCGMGSAEQLAAADCFYADVPALAAEAVAARS
jgi:HAD superfamily hydrolase (TIGR01509 family)